MKNHTLIALGFTIVLLTGCAQTQTEELKPIQTPTEKITQQENISIAPTQSTTISAEPAKPKKLVVAENCSAFPEKLNTCSPYACNFIHPLTKQVLQKQIAGVVGGKCRYIEQIPNNGVMKCNYSPSQRIAAAQYYMSVTKANSYHFNTKIDLISGSQITTNSIDGKTLDNPLQTFIADGTCTISGY